MVLLLEVAGLGQLDDARILLIFVIESGQEVFRDEGIFKERFEFWKQPKIFMNMT